MLPEWSSPGGVGPPTGTELRPLPSCRARFERAHAVRRPPNENVAAATNINHGSRRMKLSSDVRTSSSPPRSPPTTLMTPSRSIHVRPREISSRYASALANEAGHIANVEVAFADTGAMPAYSSVGRVRNDPPPATAL